MKLTLPGRSGRSAPGLMAATRPATDHPFCGAHTTWPLTLA